MANISDWRVIGINKKNSAKKPDSEYYVVSCIRDNDSLLVGSEECRSFIVNERGLDDGIGLGSFVAYFGDPKGFGFLRNLGI